MNVRQKAWSRVLKAPLELYSLFISLSSNSRILKSIGTSFPWSQSLMAAQTQAANNQFSFAVADSLHLLLDEELITESVICPLHTNSPSLGRLSIPDCTCANAAQIFQGLWMGFLVVNSKFGSNWNAPSMLLPESLTCSFIPSSQLLGGLLPTKEYQRCPVLSCPTCTIIVLSKGNMVGDSSHMVVLARVPERLTPFT